MTIKIFGISKAAEALALRRSLAIEDQRMIGAASLLDLDNVMETGGRERASRELAYVCDRYCLDPETMTSMLHELQPELVEVG